jgi:hypothetical protein
LEKSEINPIKKFDFYLDEAGGGVPIASSYSLSSLSFYSTCLRISGNDLLIASTKSSESLLVSERVPKTVSGKLEYSG